MKQEYDFMKRLREVKFTTEYSLSKEDVKRLIQEKTERAKLYHQAVKQREGSFELERD